MPTLKLFVYFLLLTGISFSNYSLASPQESAQKNEKGFFEKGMVGVGGILSYSYNNTPSVFKGVNISSQLINQNTLHEVSFSFQESEVEVISPVKPSNALRMWDLRYSWEDLTGRKRMSGLYWMPSLGVRYKQKLKVLCPKADDYCFNEYSSGWEEVDKKGAIKPLFALKYGVRIHIKKVGLRIETQFLTDTENEFIGLSGTLFFGALRGEATDST